jgi:hypothetical protein
LTFLSGSAELIKASLTRLLPHLLRLLIDFN